MMGRALLRRWAGVWIVGALTFFGVVDGSVGAATGPARAAQVESSSLPVLAFRAPPQLAGLAQTLAGFDRAGFLPALELTGLVDPGAGILVVLADEGSAEARAAPRWVAGYASGAHRPVVLLPARAGSYPDGNIEAVLQHEVAHVLIARAASDRPLPRWFDEGLAMAASRDTSFGDRSRTAFAVLTGGQLAFSALDQAFAADDESTVQSAYALSRDLVRTLLQEHGRASAPAILAGVARGEPFVVAFERATGTSLAAFAESYWREKTLWNRLVPLLTSSALLWVGIVALAMAAFRRRRQRDAERYRRWAVEEEAALAAEASARAEASDELVN